MLKNFSQSFPLDVIRNLPEKGSTLDLVSCLKWFFLQSHCQEKSKVTLERQLIENQRKYEQIINSTVKCQKNWKLTIVSGLALPQCCRVQHLRRAKPQTFVNFLLKKSFFKFLYYDPMLSRITDCIWFLRANNNLLRYFMLSKTEDLSPLTFCNKIKISILVYGYQTFLWRHYS